MSSDKLLLMVQVLGGLLMGVDYLIPRARLDKFNTWSASCLRKFSDLIQASLWYNLQVLGLCFLGMIVSWLYFHYFDVLALLSYILGVLFGVAVVTLLLYLVAAQLAKWRPSSVLGHAAMIILAILLTVAIGMIMLACKDTSIGKGLIRNLQIASLMVFYIPIVFIVFNSILRLMWLLPAVLFALISWPFAKFLSYCPRGVVGGVGFIMVVAASLIRLTENLENVRL